MQITNITCTRNFPPPGQSAYTLTATVTADVGETIYMVESGLEASGYTNWTTMSPSGGNYVTTALLPPSGVNGPYTPKVKVIKLTENIASGNPVN